MKNHFFNSFNSNSYVYNGLSNLVFPLEHIYDQNHDHNPNLTRRETLLSYMSGGFQQLANKYNIFNNNDFLNSISLSEDYYKQMLRNHPHPQLILNVTEQCNLRCKYCIYSGEYETFRTHSSNKMNKDIMKKSINLFFNYIDEWELFNANILPIISFYGGEPLLERDFILEAINYIESFNKPVILGMTTNATLLTKNLIEELVSHNVVLFISMDGNQEVHDRNRVFPSGAGSFDYVFSKLKDIKTEIEKQGKLQALPLVLLVTIDDFNDIPAINNFFQKERTLFANIPIRVSTVRKGCNDGSRSFGMRKEFFLRRNEPAGREWLLLAHRAEL